MDVTDQGALLRLGITGRFKVALQEGIRSADEGMLQSISEGEPLEVELRRRFITREILLDPRWKRALRTFRWPLSSDRLLDRPEIKVC
jgi:hypothetical protein